MAARRVSSPPNVFARWRSREKKSFSWQITPSMIWRFPSEASPPAIGLRPCPAGVLVRGGGHQRPVLLKPATLPLPPREPFVRQVGLVTIPSHEGFPYGPLVGGRRSQPEVANHPIGIHHEGHLQAVDPLKVLEALLPKVACPQKSLLLASLALTLTMAGMRVVSITR